jgi:hypothetical protein
MTSSRLAAAGGAQVALLGSPSVADVVSGLEHPRRAATA